MSLSIARFPLIGVTTENPTPAHYREEAHALRQAAKGERNLLKRDEMFLRAIRFEKVGEKVWKANQQRAAA